MNRDQLTNGLREIGLGIILFIATLEISNILISTDTVVLTSFIVKIISYIFIVFGCITTIMAFTPENKKINNKIMWEKKDEKIDQKKD